MRKIFAVLLAAMLVSLTACGGSSAGNEKTSSEASSAVSSGVSGASAASQDEMQTVTFTDALGRTVTAGKPERTVSLIGSFADIWCLAGGKDSLVAAADDTWTQFDLGLSESVQNIGAVKEPNTELVLASKPDFVLASTKTDADVEMLEILEQAGITVAYFDVSSFEDYLDMLKVCTDLNGRPDLYEQYGEAVQKQVEDACARAEGKEGSTVLYLRASGSSCKVKGGSGTVLGEMLTALGCVNIADSDTSLLEELSMEAILAADPDYIFIVMQGSDQEKVQQTLDKAVLSSPAWQQLTAVQEGRCYYMDQKLYNLKPNARWGEAYEGLADILYGE